MMSNRTIASAIAAIALSAAIAGTTLAASPTYSGITTCVGTAFGTVQDMDKFSGATKQEINFWKRYWTDNGTCVKGTYDTSALTRD